MKAKEIAEKLGKATKSGNEWSCLCPCHEDKNPSLTIRDDDKLDILVKCHAGCSQESVIARLKELGLWIASTPSSISKKLVAIYSYKDLAGQTLYEKLRYFPKKFSQRRKDSSGKYVYKNIYDGVEKVIYNLPSVAEAIRNNEPIYFVEGEKDADNLIQLGLVATTIVEGAGMKKWSKSYSEQLTGAKVILIPDNDGAGKQFADLVIKELHSHVVSIRLLNLPDLQEKGDVSDYLANGGTKESLLKLVEDTKAHTDVDFEKILQKSKDDLGEGELSADALIADMVINEIGESNLIYAFESFYLYQNVFWQSWSDKTLQKIIYKHYKSDLNSNRLSSVTKLVAVRVSKTRKEIICDKELINCLNGQLEFSNDAGKFVLKPHRKEDYQFTHIPFEYNPNADCPKFIEALRQWFAGEDDIEERIKLVFELIGYSLINTSRFETCILLTGAGANGKSVLLHIVTKLVGLENYVSVSPHNFGNKFQRAHLNNKLVNIVAELNEELGIPEAELKEIISGEPMTVEQKYKPPFEIKPYCTVWMATNHLPLVKDSSNAVYRRMKVLTFNNKFEGENANRNLKHELEAELEGILAKAIEAFGLVMKNGGNFTEPRSCTEVKQQWRMDNNHLDLFIEERCQLGKEFSVPVRMFYDTYLCWCMAEHIEPLTTIKLVRKLRVKGIVSARNSAVRYYKGIALNG